MGQAGGVGMRFNSSPPAGVTDRVLTNKKMGSNCNSVFFSFLPFQVKEMCVIIPCCKTNLGYRELLPRGNQ